MERGFFRFSTFLTCIHTLSNANIPLQLNNGVDSIGLTLTLYLLSTVASHGVSLLVHHLICHKVSLCIEEGEDHGNTDIMARFHLQCLSLHQSNFVEDYIKINKIV